MCFWKTGLKQCVGYLDASEACDVPSRWMFFAEKWHAFTKKNQTSFFICWYRFGILSKKSFFYTWFWHMHLCLMARSMARHSFRGRCFQAKQCADPNLPRFSTENRLCLPVKFAEACHIVGSFKTGRKKQKVMATGLYPSFGSPDVFQQKASESSLQGFVPWADFKSRFSSLVRLMFCVLYIGKLPFS